MVYVKKNVLQVTVLRISSPALEMELFLAVFFKHMIPVPVLCETFITFENYSFL